MSQVTLSGVAVEKGTKAVILANFSVFGERKFNNLQANFEIETLRKESFNSHRRLHSLTPVSAKWQCCHPEEQPSGSRDNIPWTASFS